MHNTYYNKEVYTSTELMYNEIMHLGTVNQQHPRCQGLGTAAVSIHGVAVTKLQLQLQRNCLKNVVKILLWPPKTTFVQCYSADVKFFFEGMFFVKELHLIPYYCVQVSSLYL